MKLLKYITLFAITAFMAVSCSDDVDVRLINSPEQFVAPVISSCSNVIVNANNSEAESVIFTWQPADFGLPLQILYSVYLEKDGESAMLGTSYSTSFSISKGDFNGAVINGLGVAANETVEVKAYVTAQISGTNEYAPISSARSNSFSVVTFMAPLKWYHLCGQFMNWTIAEAPIFWETAGGTNQYTCMVDFSIPDAVGDETHSYFKVTAEQNWSADNWGYNFLTPSWDCPEQADSNLAMPLDEGNIFQVTVNTSVMTIDKKNIGKTLGVIGSFNDWNGDAPLIYNHIESAWLTEPIELAAGDQIKIRVDGGWTLNWGTSGTMSSVISGGYETAVGGDNVVVAEAGIFIVKLHANRTPFVIELVKQ